mmetsp:Transcript_16446/g.39358  ORF Transcript_16446/g.39358 Transcript_16446/m.39358 type:complete len:237 (-) Transcript_16446:237-947(-)
MDSGMPPLLPPSSALEELLRCSWPRSDDDWLCCASTATDALAADDRFPNTFLGTSPANLFTPPLLSGFFFDAASSSAFFSSRSLLLAAAACAYVLLISSSCACAILRASDVAYSISDAPEGGSSHTRCPVFRDWKYGRSVRRWEDAATSASTSPVGFFAPSFLAAASSAIFWLEPLLDLNLRNRPPPFFLDDDASPPCEGLSPGLTGASQTARASTQESLSAVYLFGSTRADRRAE